MSSLFLFVKGKIPLTKGSMLQIKYFSASELPGERECEATVLVRGADLPGHGHQQQQTDIEPNLQLDQRTIRVLQTRGSVMDGEFYLSLVSFFFSIAFAFLSLQ